MELNSCYEKRVYKITYHYYISLLDYQYRIEEDLTLKYLKQTPYTYRILYTLFL